MRPQRLSQVAGQDHLVGAGAPLRTLIEAGRVPSMVFWGPPGCGKTTLARLVSSESGSAFVQLSAVMAGVKDIREAVARAQMLRQAAPPRGTILFIDEIHRFNKGQQDALLPFVEDGTLVLVGATTENPSFELNSALLSRLRVFVLKTLAEPAIRALLDRALVDSERGLGGSGIQVPEAWMQRIAGLADGDARRALVLLETAAELIRAAGARPRCAD